VSDPLASVVPGQTSPLINRTDTVNAVLEAARSRRNQRSGELVGQATRDNLVPSAQVYIRNDTGGSLAVFSVVALGTPIVSAIDYPHEVRRQPIFPGTAPAAATDAFAIILEPAATSGVVLAAVLGVAVCDINVTNSAHTHASPTTVTTYLTSGTSGPARIIWKDSGTGTKRAVVLLCGQAAGSGGSVTVAEADGTPSYASTSTLQFDQADGFVVSQPVAGTAKVDISAAANGSVGIVSAVDQTLGAGTKVVQYLGIAGSVAPGATAPGSHHFREHSTSFLGFWQGASTPFSGECDGNLRLGSAVVQGGSGNGTSGAVVLDAGGWIACNNYLSVRDRTDADLYVAAGVAESVLSGTYTGPGVRFSDAGGTDVVSMLLHTDGVRVVVGRTSGNGTKFTLHGDCFAVHNGTDVKDGLSGTATVKDGSGTNRTVTFRGGLIVGWEGYTAAV
jgi:hypothetical protein